MQETWVQSLGWENPLEKVMATLSSILAWRISWTEEPGRLQPMASQRVRHDWGTNTHMMCVLLSSLCCMWENCSIGMLVTNPRSYRKWVTELGSEHRLVLIAHCETCSFRTRNQAWSLKSFCVAEFYSSEKGTGKASDIDIRRGMEIVPLLVLASCFLSVRKLLIR